MKKAAYLTLLVLSLAGAFLAGSWHNQRSLAKERSTGGRKILYYTCPMHPQYRSDRPGDAPCCGMRLEPLYDGGAPAAQAVNGSAAPAADAVDLGPEKQQLIGVRVSAVEKATFTHTLRLFGRVAPDETRVYKLVAGVEGFIRQVSTITTGSRVEKDQWLATFSAPEARAPVQSFLVTLDTLDRQTKGGADAPAQIKAAAGSIQLAIDRLLNVGLSAVQIEEIRRTREVPTDFRILAPAAGFVLSRNASPGQKFNRGEDWYRIADLSRVWILADVFPNEAQYLRPGVRARVSLPQPKKTLVARVAEVLPQFDAGTRTLKVRLEADNPGYAFRPDMFVDIELLVALPPAISVAADAVLDSGLRKTVFVDRGEGFFEPREVEIGWRFGDRVEITRGLEAGERIVASGTFLVDSESRMKLAAASTQPAAKDPVCGMDVDAAKTQLKAGYNGK